MNPEVKTPKYVTERARELRLNMTGTEMLLWERLRKRQLDGYRFRNQHPLYRYILDFYCHEKKLAVEIDGQVHEDRKDYDDYRDAFIKSIGIETLRFMDIEVREQIEDVVDRIRKKLKV